MDSVLLATERVRRTSPALALPRSTGTVWSPPHWDVSWGPRQSGRAGMAGRPDARKGLALGYALAQPAAPLEPPRTQMRSPAVLAAAGPGRHRSSDRRPRTPCPSALRFRGGRGLRRRRNPGPLHGNAPLATARTRSQHSGSCCLLLLTTRDPEPAAPWASGRVRPPRKTRGHVCTGAALKGRAPLSSGLWHQKAALPPRGHTRHCLVLT